MKKTSIPIMIIFVLCGLHFVDGLDTPACADTVKIRLATEPSKPDMTALLAEKFAEIANANLGDKVQVKLFLGGVLGSQKALQEQIKLESERRAELLKKRKLLETKITESLLAMQDTCPHCGVELPFVRSLTVGDLDKISRLLGFTAGDVDSRPAGGITESDAQKWLKEKRDEIAKMRGETASQKVKT